MAKRKEESETKRKRKCHSKSRTGCSHCKQLRIKCDEARPVCNNCVRRGKNCVYHSPPDPDKDSRSVSSAHIKAQPVSPTSFVRPSIPSSQAPSVTPSVIPSLASSAPLLAPNPKPRKSRPPKSRPPPLAISSATFSVTSSATFSVTASATSSVTSAPQSAPPTVTTAKTQWDPRENFSAASTSAASAAAAALSLTWTEPTVSAPSASSIVTATRAYAPPMINHLGTLFPRQIDLKFQDLELMHHYSFNAEQFIMFKDTSDKDVWLNVVPKYSFTSSYLADALLSISALHLRHASRGLRDLQSYALEKYYAAMKQSQLHDISTDFECKFLSSCFLMMLGFAFDDVIHLLEPSGLDLFGLMRGPRILVENLYDYLKQGPLSPLIFDVPSLASSEFVDSKLPLPVYDNLYTLVDSFIADSHTSPYAPPTHLQRNGSTYMKTPESAEPTDHSSATSPASSATSPTRDIPPLRSHIVCNGVTIDVYKACHQAIDLMVPTIRTAISYNMPPVLISWMAVIPSEFLLLARHHHPLAKVIIAYHLAALHSCSSYFWVGSRPAREVAAIAASLPPQWQRVMRWPMDVCKIDHFTLSDLTAQSARHPSA